MIFIFGGAYQGKTDYAVYEYGLKPFSCTGKDIDWSSGIICHLEKLTMECVKTGEDVVEFMESKRKQWKDKVLICDDVSQGIVPMEVEKRTFREANGRLMIYLAGEAERVVRVFCGLAQEIKR